MVLDKTKTAMGARNLRKYIEQPLVQKYDIEKRLDALNELLDNAISREEIREYLSPIYDLERLVSKITYQSANPRDMIAFESSLSMLPHIKYILSEMTSPLLKELYEDLDTLEDLCTLIKDAIKERIQFIGIEDGRIVAAYIMNHDRDEAYHAVKWLIDANDNETVVLHALRAFRNMEVVDTRSS